MGGIRNNAECVSSESFCSDFGVCYYPAGLLVSHFDHMDLTLETEEGNWTKDLQVSPWVQLQNRHSCESMRVLGGQRSAYQH